jgi:hypothetical protein
MSTYTEEEVQARITKLIPSEASLDRSRYVDGDDLLDSLKERVARCVYSRIEAPYYFAYLAGIKILEDLSTVSAALSDIDRCIPAMRITIPTVVIDLDTISYSVDSALNAETDVIASAKIALLTSKIRTAAQSVSKPVFDSVQAEPILVRALATIKTNLTSIRDRTYYLTQLLQRVSSANLLYWVQRRQLKSVSRTLYNSSNTDPSTILDLVLSTSLLDVKTNLSIDFKANKYYGGVVPGTPTNRYTLSGTVPTGQLAIRKGDILHTGNPLTGYVINSYSNGILYLETAVGPGAVNAYVSSSAVVSYQTLLPQLEAAITALNAAVDSDFVSKAGLTAYGNTGYSEYNAARLALIAGLSALQGALGAFSVSLVDEVKALVESFREERLFSVLALLETLDFVAITESGADGFSLSSTAKDLLEQLATQFGAETPDAYVHDSDPLYDELVQRRITK